MNDVQVSQVHHWKLGYSFTFQHDDTQYPAKQLWMSQSGPHLSPELNLIEKLERLGDNGLTIILIQSDRG